MVVKTLSVTVLSQANIPELVGMGHEIDDLRRQLKENSDNYYVSFYVHTGPEWDGKVREADFWDLTDVIEIPDKTELEQMAQYLRAQGWVCYTMFMIKPDSELTPAEVLIRRRDDHEFISFIQDVVGGPLSSWQKETLLHMRQTIAEGKPLDFSYRADKKGRYQ